MQVFSMVKGIKLRNLLGSMLMIGLIFIVAMGLVAVGCLILARLLVITGSDGTAYG